MQFKIVTTNRFEKDFRSLEKKEQKRLRQAIHKMSVDPYGANREQDIKKLKDLKSSYRLRAGNLRVIFKIDAKKGIINLLTVTHKREVYR